MQGIRVQTGIHDSHRKFRIDAGNQESSRDSGSGRKYGLKQAIGPMQGGVPDSRLVSLICTEENKGNLYLESLNTYGMESKTHIQSVGNQVMDRRHVVRGMEP
jgi:hypothetical protein